VAEVCRVEHRERAVIASGGRRGGGRGTA
jgi:hypothetical protein